MALKALWNPNIQFLKTDGTINAGGKLVVTDHNDAESIPANYSDADGTTLNASPIVLDALGRATCYIDDGSTYDLYVKDANGATLWTVTEMTPGSETIVVRAGFSVSSNDRSVSVVISVDQNGVTNYDLSIQKEIDRATEAEKASRTEIVAGDNITVEKTVGADGQDVYTVSGERGDNLVDDVRVNGASVVTDKVANIDVPVAGTASPLMDGNASVGNSLKYAREDHVHPSDTSREDKANKTTVVLGTSNSKYPTDKAVADFVNSSIATNTANYISNNGEPFTSVEQLEAYSGTVTNNDYAFVTGTDSEGNTYYDRYKATVSGSTVTWALEYRLNNSSFTAAQWSAINSGITSALVAKIHTHSNKDVLDGITSTDVANWNSKQNSLTFDSEPTAGSTNPVTSDGIYNSMYSIPTPAKPSSFTKDGKSYSFVCRTKVSAWTRSAFEGYAFPVDWSTFDMIRIRSIVYADAPTDAAIASITCGKSVYEKFNFVQTIYNGYCYIFANNPFRSLYINPNKYLNSDTNSSYMTQDIFNTLTLTKINPSIDDVTLDTTPTAGSKNPVTSDGIKTAIGTVDAKGLTIKEISGEEVICFE